MKVEFWKHQSAILIAVPFFIGCSLLLIVLGIVLMITQSIGYLGILLFGTIIFLFSMIYIFVNPNILSKVEYSEDGILQKRFKKKILMINWNEISDVTTRPRGRAAYDLVFIAGNKEIFVDLTKKMYDAIMIVCPEPNIKMQINELNEFKWFH